MSDLFWLPEAQVDRLRPYFPKSRGTQVRQNRLGSGRFLGVESSPVSGLGWLEPRILVVTRVLSE